MNCPDEVKDARIVVYSDVRIVHGMQYQYPNWVITGIPSGPEANWQDPEQGFVYSPDILHIPTTLSAPPQLIMASNVHDESWIHGFCSLAM